MKIYSITDDANSIPRLIPVDNKYYKFKCESLKDNWIPYEVYNASPAKRIQNFYSLGKSGVLVFDKYTLEICRTIFKMAGEILPIKVERGEDLYLLNVLECLNGLNYNTTVWDYYDDGTKGRILKYGFHLDGVSNKTNIFKIPENKEIGLFCYADIKNPDDEFYHIYHKYKLTGLIFEEVYNDEQTI
jgi:hypothetical protein